MILFKDFLQHFDQCEPQIDDSVPRLVKDDHGFQLQNFKDAFQKKFKSHPEIKIVQVSPIRIDCFEEVFIVDCGWMNYMLSFQILIVTESPDRAKNYKYTLKIQDDDEEYNYKGHVIPAGDTQFYWFGQHGLTFNVQKAIDIQKKTGKFFIQVNILKDKDDKMETSSEN